MNVIFGRLVVGVKNYVSVGLGKLFQLIEKALKHGQDLVDSAKAAAMVFAAPL
jgi:hypothetical protein